MAVYLGNRLVLANGVAGTSLANGHGQTHAAGGGDEVTPASIGAAPAVHTHSEYASKPETVTLTLTRAGWNQSTYTCVQTVGVSGMRSSKYAIVGPAPLHWGTYTQANVRCTVQGYNSLTFAADKLPTGDIEVNVLIWG